MKKYIISSFLFVTITVTAQVAIGKETISGTSTLLDFYDAADNLRGIILPAVDAVSALNADNNGTFLFDRSDKKLKMYENNIWIELSEEGNDSNLEINLTNENNQDQGVIIGSETSDAKG